MSYKNIKNSKGFTIIEVLIVLAIAGLILLVVFMAVPALQRNQRNTSIKNDVHNILGGVGEYQNVNNGAMPPSIAATGGIVSYGTGGSSTNIKIQGSTTVSALTGVAIPSTAPDPGTIQYKIGYKCPDSGTGNLVVSARAVAAIYSLETSSSNVVQCQST